MAGSIRIQRLVFRGLDPLHPKLWEVWGTSRNCRSVDVRFLFPASDVDAAPASAKTVTVVPRRRADRPWEVECAEDEDLWVARFYAEEHPQLWDLREWLKAAEGRVVEIEARSAAPGVGDPVPGAATVGKTTFRETDVLVGAEFEAGVLLVHGIGPHGQGETLVRFTEPVIAFLQRWLRGVSDRWSTTYSGAEAAGWRDQVLNSTLRHQQNLFDLTDKVHRFVRQSAQPGPKSDRTSVANLMSGEFLVGDVCAIDTVLRPLASEPQIAGCTLLRMSSLGQSGALEQTHLLLTEAWWTKDVAPPTSAQLRDWIFYALPQVVSTYLATPMKAIARQRAAEGNHPSVRTVMAQWVDALNAVLLRAPLALLFCAIMQVLLTVVATLALVPIPWLRAVLKPILHLLMGTTGQSYAMVTSELRRSAIVSKVGRQLDWLCERCEKVIVLAHSQGAEVSRHVIAARTRWNVRHFVSFGSGVKMLGVLTSDPPSRRHFACATCALVILLLFVAGSASSGIPLWRWLLATYGALILIGVKFLEPPDYNQTFRKSVPLTDYYASRDPVPCGPLSDDTVLLGQIGFQLIEVHNRASVIFDHTSYLENIEEFVAPVALAIAELAGMPVANLMKDDPQRLDAAKARRRRLVSDKLLIGRLAAFGLAVAVLLSLALHPGAPAEATTALMSRRDFGWGDWFSEAGRLPELVYAALPVFVVAGLFVVERSLLHGRFTRNVDALVTRHEPGPERIAVAVRALAYGVGAAAFVWWARQEHLGTALAAIVRRLIGG